MRGRRQKINNNILCKMYEYYSNNHKTIDEPVIWLKESRMRYLKNNGSIYG